MAFDGIITMAVTAELSDVLLYGRIDKIYQPEKEELVFNIHTRDNGNVRLFASASSTGPRVHLIETNPLNPQVPSGFCMLLRKHLQGGRIIEVKQKGTDRIIEIDVETLNEMGFTVSRKIIFEIMGRHSNIIIVDMNDGKILDSIKRVSIDASRVRPVLPGRLYEYPPEQNKIPFTSITNEDFEKVPRDRRSILSLTGGISPAIAEELASKDKPVEFLKELTASIERRDFTPHTYVDKDGTYREFHIAELSSYTGVSETIYYESLSKCIADYFEHKESTNRVRQRGNQLQKNVRSQLEKLELKMQRLGNDLVAAENSEDLRLFGELLTASLHSLNQGDEKAEVLNYYTGEMITIPLNPKYSPSKNAQRYFKKYGKAKTAVKEKKKQMAETEKEINYLDSVLTFIENTDRPEDIDTIRTELVETGYIRKRKQKGKPVRFKAKPYTYTLSSGKTVYAGRNNKENDLLTMKKAKRTDLWFHTKDIPGSHVILSLEGKEPETEDIIEAASIAAWHSKGRLSENVPVDYTYIKYVKKPNGAKPGMVIFTDNSTIWANPHLPEENK